MTLATVGVSLVISTMPMLTPSSSAPSCQMNRKSRMACRHAHPLLERTTLQQNAELVPAQSRQGVAAAHTRLQHSRDLLEQLIAGRMPAGVVEQFELIQIKIQQR